jgi:hypothetical protein
LAASRQTLLLLLLPRNAHLSTVSPLAMSLAANKPLPFSLLTRRSCTAAVLMPDALHSP